MARAEACGSFFTAYGRVEWRDKLWKLLQNLARVVAWAVVPQQQAGRVVDVVGLGDAAAAFARGISTSRKGFRLGKWLRPLERLLAMLVVVTRMGRRTNAELSGDGGNNAIVPRTNANVLQLATSLARGCMVGYGVWDNLVFLSSVGVLGDRARGRAKAYKIRSHKFRFFGNVLDAMLTYREWSHLCSIGVGVVGSRVAGKRRNGQRGGAPRDDDDDDGRTGPFASNSSQRRGSLDGDALRQARENALRAYLCKCCSAFESFSHAKFCARVLGRDISPGLIGLSGIVSSSLVLYAKWPDDNK
jgi:hypothetical protein